MKLTGHETERVYRRYAIVSERDLGILRDGRKCPVVLMPHAVASHKSLENTGL